MRADNDAVFWVGGAGGLGEGDGVKDAGATVVVR